MDVARVKYTMLRNEATDVLSVNHKSYDNKYTLNAEKSLRKKLESTNRTVIEYSLTGGGITVKFDTVTFELFIYACEIYFSDNANKELSFKKSSAKDKSGNLVKYTYHITNNYTQITINAYLAKCSLLINGKNTQGFIDGDIPLIHCIMSNTKINGVSLNIEQLNQSLKLKLEKALSVLSKPETSMNCSDSNKIDKKIQRRKMLQMQKKL